MNKKVIVTGSNGFIGHHVADYLENHQGYECYCLDRSYEMSTSRVDLARPYSELIKNGVIDHLLSMASLDGGVPKALVHLAALPSVPKSFNDPYQSALDTYVSSVNMMRLARALDIPFIFTSTSAVYADQQNPTPLSEYAPLRPLSPYAVEKLAVESHCEMLADQNLLDSVCLRLGNIYGPGQKPSDPYAGVISIFMKHKKNGTTPTIYGTGDQTRDYVYVNDVARVIDRVIDQFESQRLAHRKKSYVMNVGTGRGTSVNDLWKILNLAAPRYRDARQGDTMHSVLSNGKLLKFFPDFEMMSLEDGLRNTYELSYA